MLRDSTHESPLLVGVPGIILSIASTTTFTAFNYSIPTQIVLLDVLLLNERRGGVHHA